MSSDFDAPRLAKLAAAGTQLSVLVHEIRQPLFALQAFLDLQGPGGQGDADFLESMREQVRRLEELVSQYGHLGREKMPPQPTDFNAAISKTASWMRHRAKQYGATLHLSLIHI